MATNYPAGLDTVTELPNNRADATATATNHKNDHNNLADAVIAIEAELGVTPSGSESTVVARLDALDTTNTNVESNANRRIFFFK